MCAFSFVHSFSKHSLNVYCLSNTDSQHVNVYEETQAQKALVTCLGPNQLVSATVWMQTQGHMISNFVLFLKNHITTLCLT